jgi:hypothetical protein
MQRVEVSCAVRHVYIYIYIYIYMSLVGEGLSGGGESPVKVCDIGFETPCI